MKKRIILCFFIFIATAVFAEDESNTVYFSIIKSRGEKRVKENIPNSTIFTDVDISNDKKTCLWNVTCGIADLIQVDVPDDKLITIPETPTDEKNNEYVWELIYYTMGQNDAAPGYASVRFNCKTINFEIIKELENHIVVYFI